MINVKRFIALFALLHAEAGLAEAVEAFELISGRGVLLRAERLVLLAGEEVGVAGDDLGLLRHLLLADAHGAPLLRALEQVALELRLKLRVIPGQGDGHRENCIYVR